jgi:hypothetical protein
MLCPAIADTLLDGTLRANSVQLDLSPGFLPAGGVALLSSLCSPSHRRQTALWRAFQRPVPAALEPHTHTLPPPTLSVIPGRLLSVWRAIKNR